MTDKEAVRELSRLVAEAEWLDLTPREKLALERAIYVLNTAQQNFGCTR